MKTLKEMNLGQLVELKNDHIAVYQTTQCEMYREHALEVQAEIISRTVEVVESKPVVKVYFQQGYRWSVDVSGEEESIIINVTKKEAMTVAKELVKRLGATLEEQKLTKTERKENISYLANNTSVYKLF